MIRRPPRSTLSSSSAASDVYKRQDILTLGKGLGAGFPISATLAREQVCCFEQGDQGGTFNGNPLAAAVANTVLTSVTAPGFLAHVIEMGSYLHERLWKLAETRKFKQIRGKGLLWAVDMGSDIAAAVRDTAFEQGLIINAARPSVLRLMPSLRVTVEEIDEAIACLDESLTSVTAA